MFNMEELWEKFKKETREHLEIVNEFIEEKSVSNNTNETLPPQPKTVEVVNAEISQNVFIDEDEKSPLKKKPKFPRKRKYGSLKDKVNELMEKEKISRAHAYRMAKKMQKENQ